MIGRHPLERPRARSPRWPGIGARAAALPAAVALLLAGFAPVVPAAGGTGGVKTPTSLRGVVDNDEFVGLNRRDRWYSSGVSIAVARPTDAPPDPVLAALPCAPPDQAVHRRAWSLDHVIMMQNRRDLGQAQPNDRPIAGLLQIGHQRGLFHASGDAGWAVDVGVTGPAALGEPIQNGLHRLLDVQQVGLWSQQLRPRLSLNLRAHCLWRTALDERGRWAFSAGGGIVLGTLLAQIEGVVALAAGPAATQMRPVREARLGWPEPAIAAHWGLIAGLRVRAVGHDALIEGDTFGYVNGVRPRALVGEWFVGGRWRLGPRWSLGCAAVHRTMDFTGPGVDAAGFEPQTFGQITLQLDF